MNFILLPYLLAVRLPDNENGWKNGPEYTFNATVCTYFEPGSSPSDESKATENVFTGTTLKTNMKCRPKEPNELHCHFEDTMIANLTTKTSYAELADGQLQMAANYTTFDFGNNSFEIKFNEDGIESYKFNVVPEPDDYTATMYKLIAGHLNLWSKIDTVKRIKRIEMTSVGGCPVTYDVETTKPENKTMDGPFVITKPLNVDMTEELEIKKQVHLDECSPQATHIFGSRHTYGIIPDDSTLKLQSSKGRVSISSHNFISTTCNKFYAYDLNKTMIGTLRDLIHLTFDNVEPVKKELRTLPNLSTLA
ncbi:uncharacterized protein LOC116428358 [Nomia melanderi]|uniref:uncharacterized protein LOC116428358 n=1 Tax=Nomia melanderi TaxID=2448451 RepID=UPI001304085E|nr:uncharacterized protein LOC116428358 [Nomia melanderi]